MDPADNASGRLLFVHSTGPTHVHRRDKRTKTNMRRHVMREIGESRRVARRNPTFTPLMRPFWDQDPLSMLDQHWPMDAFSAYGLALLGTRSQKPAESRMASDAGNFCLPFAFTASGFLHHFLPLINSPDLLQVIYHQSSARALNMALKRSMGTITCIEESLASSDADFATRDEVIHAILALICFNLTNLDYDQALTHAKGLRSVIAARGGTSSLQGNSNLVLMVFWVDIIMSLVFSMRPSYPVPWTHLPAHTLVRPRTGLPSQLFRLIEALVKPPVSFCVNELALVAQIIESQLAEKGDATWNQEMFIGLQLNPLVHQLLDTTVQYSPEGLLASHTTEIIRLGAILWVIWVKQRARSYPGSPMKYVSELLRLLSMKCDLNDHFVWEASNDILSVKLWVIAICGISCPSESPERGMTAKLMADTGRRLEIRDWQGAQMHVRQMPWISAFDSSYAYMWSQLH